MSKNLGAYGRAASTTRSRSAAARSPKRYLSLDQAMVLGAIGNQLVQRDVMRRFVSTGAIRAEAHAR